MKSIYLWLSSLLLGLITITAIVQSREYHVKASLIASYIYKKIDNIQENIFPANMRINVSVSRSVGTLLYSIDKNMNQLIVSLHDGLPHVIKVEFNRQEIIQSLPELCGCERCRYEILDLRIQLNTHINIRCNGGNPYIVRIMKKKEINENYPILFTRTNNKKDSTNEAHMWLVNTPQYQNVYPNNQQMYGCIFDVSYMDKPIHFTNTTSGITHPCIRLCSPNVCNGGQCLETFNDYPVCNCTAEYLNGRYCNESIHPMNLRSSKQLFIFDIIKLSWNSSVNTIFTISNKNIRISLYILNENLLVELKYLKNNTTVTLPLHYVRNNPSICIIYFKDKFIDIWLFNNGSLRNGIIFGEYDLRREIFESLTLQSGNGNISLHTKSDEEYAWRKVNIGYPIEIENDTNIGLNNNVTFKMNIQGSNIELDNKVTPMMYIQGHFVIVMIMLVVVLFSIIIGLIIVIAFCMKRSKKKFKYTKLKGNDDDYPSKFSDTHKEYTKKDIVKMKDQPESSLFRLFKKEHKEYINVCMREIGYNIVKKDDRDIKKWKTFILKKIQKDAILNNQLERMYEVMKDITQEETYLRDIILLLIHTRIFAVPSISVFANNHPSIKYLAALLSDKYNHKDELQGLSKQVIECMMDFLEDLSPYNNTDNIFHKLLYEMLAFVGYNIVINEYKYTNNRNVTFLQKYSSKDNLERLWSAVIMYVHTRESTHISMLKEYLNTNVIQGENVSKDIIMLSLAIPRLRVAHNFDESSLTIIDYQLIVDIEQYKILSKENIQIITVNIIKIFNHKYKEGIIQSMKDNSDLTSEHKMSIDCLKASLQKGLINEDKLILLTSLLDEFYLNAAKNNEADHIMQSVLNHLFQHKHYQNEKIKDKLYYLCIEYFRGKKISDGIKLSSSLIICYTAATMTNTPHIDDVIKYLADIIDRMITRGSESLNLSDFNLPITEIERVLLKITPNTKDTQE